MTQGIVYFILINDTFEQYVGVTKNRLRRRMHQHKVNNNQLVDRKINKHGCDYFELEKCDLEDLSNREIYYIDLFNTLKERNVGGLNLTTGGIKNTIFTDSFRKLMSEIHTEHWQRPEFREKAIAEMKKSYLDPEIKRIHSETTRSNWKSPEMQRRQKESRSMPDYIEKRARISSDMWKKPGMRDRLCKKMVKLSKTGEFIKIYDSLTDAAKSVNKNDCSAISMVCKGHRTSHAGYKWMYYDDYIKYLNTK